MLPRTVFFDLDNTLAVSKQAVAPDMAEALSKLIARTKVAVISGGALEQLRTQVAEKLPAGTECRNFYLLPTSGGALYAYEQGAWQQIYQEQLSPEEVTEITARVEEGARATGLVDFSHELYGQYIEARGAQVSLSALGQHAPVDAKNAWDPTREKREQLQTAIAPLLPNYDVKIGGTTTIDITKRGVNKAHGVRKFAAYSGIPVSDMLYVGDQLWPGGNDDVVKESGIRTHTVVNPDETLQLITELINAPQA
jgi:HAD superfamily hydrolase (TIGR01484 family)